MRTWTSTVSCIALAAACLMASEAEASRGRCQVDGIVTDQDGKPVPAAKIFLRHVASGGSVEVRTNAMGHWAARNIAEGEWELKFSRGGYLELMLTRSIYPKQKRNRIQTTLHKTPFDPELASAEKGWDFAARTPPGPDPAVLMAAGDLRKVIESLQALLARAPDALDLHTRLGDAYLQLGDYDHALEAYRFVHDKDSGSVAALSNLAQVYLKKKDVDNALIYLDKLLELSPHHAAANYNMAEILLSADEPEEAIQHYQAAITGRPGWAAAYLKIGYASMTLGRSLQARTAFQKYLALEPNGAEAGFVRDTLELLK